MSAQSEEVDKSPHKPGFVQVNNVKLHYLDWGGAGDTMLFLAGIGGTPHVFDKLAPKFTNRFRVLGLTRRGHGESEIPASGYDTATRVEDIRQFLDALKIQRAILVGHSASGGELTMFGGLHPDRTIKLVYLDAVFDRDGQVELFIRRYCLDVQPGQTQIANASTDQEKRAKVLQLMPTREAHTDFKKVQSPVLAFHVVGFSSNRLNFFETLEPDPKARQALQATVLQIKAREIERFRKELPAARVVYFTNADHACFIDREADVVREMRAFLGK
ncbi:MAG TPA: alpha/beta hydrolase [Candidatus Eisenbacteria bacterium]|nr:alpha/beta hydrolase [Candidatus Eisenbacteria bacterium]